MGGKKEDGWIIVWMLSGKGSQGTLELGLQLEIVQKDNHDSGTWIAARYGKVSRYHLLVGNG